MGVSSEREAHPDGDGRPPSPPHPWWLWLVLAGHIVLVIIGIALVLHRADCKGPCLEHCQKNK